MDIKRLVFNLIQENTYIVSDATGECVIIDPGCIASEQHVLRQYLDLYGLTPKAVINTHCHFDHVFGVNFVCDTYNVDFWAHENELDNLRRFMAAANLYSIPGEQPRNPDHYLTDGMSVTFGNSELKVIFTPGHSAGSVCFYSAEDGILFSGDTLFSGTIGRTDLPGSDYDSIVRSLARLTALPGDTKVYCGHAQDTTLSYEKAYNPFLNFGNEML
jgi:glyoxylase-like metal-dependent hydrolase (beta-lactamase superfamily II)